MVHAAQVCALLALCCPTTKLGTVTPRQGRAQNPDALTQLEPCQGLTTTCPLALRPECLGHPMLRQRGVPQTASGVVANGAGFVAPLTADTAPPLAATDKSLTQAEI
jgi:hypothetical protein